MPAIITYPLNFDETKKYPVIFTIYGGPDSKNIRVTGGRERILRGMHRTALLLLPSITGDRVISAKKDLTTCTVPLVNGKSLIMKML